GGREPIGVQALRHLHQRGLRLSLQQAGGLGDEARELRLPELEAEPGHRRERQTRGADAPAHQPVEDEREHRESGNQRAIEVEEGADPRSRRALVDVARDVVEPRQGGRSIASRAKRGQPSVSITERLSSRSIRTAAMAYATQQTTQEDVTRRRVVFLLDACSSVELRILRQWIAEHHVPTGIPWDAIPIPPTRRRWRSSRPDPRLDAAITA